MPAADPALAADSAARREPSTAHVAADAHGPFTTSERTAVVKFLLQHDMGRAVQTDVTTLIRANDSACAVRLVMDNYEVPQETAELFVRLLSQSDGATTH